MLRTNRKIKNDIMIEINKLTKLDITSCKFLKPIDSKYDKRSSLITKNGNIIEKNGTITLLDIFERKSFNTVPVYTAIM